MELITQHQINLDDIIQSLYDDSDKIYALVLDYLYLYNENNISQLHLLHFFR